MPAYPHPAEYAVAEARGAVGLSNRAVECFRPFHFSFVGYPFSINSIDELWKYTECMHDGFGVQGPLERRLLPIIGEGFTAEEWECIKAIKSAVDDLGASIGARCQYQTHTMYYAINHARHIRAVLPPGRLIVEFGGGAGYLGALLVLMGYRYVACDISQAFYLLQSHLIPRVAPAGGINLMDEKYGPDDLAALKPGQAAIVPWWRWARREYPAALSIDLVTSNHNFLEMHPFCLMYHLSVIRDALTPDSPGLVFEGWGDPNKNPTWTAVKAFAEKGFVLAHHDNRMTCFPHASSTGASQGVLTYPLPIPTDPPPPPATPAHEIHYSVPDFASPLNPFSNAITEMRKQEKSRLTHTVADYKKLIGQTDLTTADERFLAYIFRDTPAARPWVSVPPLKK